MLAEGNMLDGIKRFFKRSETIFFARLQVLAGLIAVAIVSVDPGMIAPFVDPKWVPIIFVINGVVTEILRRARTRETRDGGLS